MVRIKMKDRLTKKASIEQNKAIDMYVANKNLEFDSRRSFFRSWKEFCDIFSEKDPKILFETLANLLGLS